MRAGVVILVPRAEQAEISAKMVYLCEDFNGVPVITTA